MLLDHLTPKNCLDLANIHNNLAGVLKDNCSYRRALTHYQMAEKLYLKSVPHNHFYLSPTYKNIGNVYRQRRKYSQSLDYHLKCLKIREQCLPSNHIEIGESLLEVALSYHYLKQNHRSISSLNRAEEIFQANKLPKDDPRLIEIQQARLVCQDD